jgi:hypothetical protein
MGDRYIDAREASEYGRYLWARLELLIGVSQLVQIPAFRQLLLAAIEDVEAEYRSTRTQQSGVRTGRTSTSESAEDLGDVLRRFYHHLETQPDDVRIDRAAFFPNQSSGALSKLKPADLLARADEVLHGFTVPLNAVLPDAARWMSDITTRRATLGESLGGKHGAAHGNRRATSALQTARERFLHVYNGMAKRLVYVALAELDRLDEYRQFFLDLQVNEGGRATPDGETGETGETGGGPEAPAL